VDLHVLGAAAKAGVTPPSPFSWTAPSTWGLPPSAIASLLHEAGWGNGVGLLQYLLWPLQFGIVRDLLGLGGIMALFNVIPMYAIWWERKVAGRIQSRLGPMRVGGWHGWSQSLADGIKLLLKEDLIPDDADKLLFRLAPYLAIIPAAAAFVALPFGATYVFRDLDVALVFILGILGIEVVGVILAGWASNNKWSVYGAMREACQMVSYEIPMGMALLVPVLTVGSLSLVKIGEAQSHGWFSWLAFTSPFCFVAFVSYFIASLASCKRAPFDLPEAESELVAGFHTEYSGIRWSFFFFAEYAAMFIVSGLAVILFLGGWNSPLPLSWADGVYSALGDGAMARGLVGLLFSGPLWFFAKVVFFIYVQIWLRWTLPRIRIDQVLYGCVQVMLPMTMILLLGQTLWVWASAAESSAWNAFALIMTIILGVIGLIFTLGFPAIAAYGFYHRRRLVGNLWVDPLPGG
jgi:NADH-quinone oxidoreductase subunit H